MSNYMERDYKIFELFRNQWALVTAGTVEDFNSCTVSWGSMGTLWTRPDSKDGAVVTVYIHPGRYTLDYLKANDTFTVSFYPETCKKALSYMGSHSGREGKKHLEAGLTPEPIGNSVTFREAEMTFVCRKIYQHQFAREDIAADVQEYYRSNPSVYPVNAQGEWEPHWVLVGEVREVREKE